MTEQVFIAIVGAVSALVGGLVSALVMLIRGWNKRGEVRTLSESNLSTQQFDLLRAAFQQLEARTDKQAERSDKQALAHREEMLRLEQRSDERAASYQTQLGRTHEQLEEIRRQLSECLGEKRDMTLQLARLQVEHDTVRGRVGVIDQTVQAYGARIAEQERATTQIKKQTDKLKLPTGDTTP